MLALVAAETVLLLAGFHRQCLNGIFVLHRICVGCPKNLEAWSQARSFSRSRELFGNNLNDIEMMRSRASWPWQVLGIW